MFLQREKKRLYMAALIYLLEEKKTHAAAYEEITELLLTASCFIAESIEKEVVPTIIRYHSQHALDEYIILWEKMLDGSSSKGEYPNLEQKLRHVRAQDRERSLSNKMKNHLLEFEKNFNQRNDERV